MIKASTSGRAAEAEVLVSEADAIEQRARVLQALLAFASTQAEVGRLFARSQAMHTTDAAAVVEILTAEDRGAPLTPARLAERIALTTGATSTLLNRLEEAGHVERTREHSDRRVVTLRSTPRIHETADSFFAPLSRHLDDVLQGYTEYDLALVAEVVGRVQETTRSHLDTIDDRAAARRPAPGRSATP